MITPVFFPFTHISSYQVKTVLTVFKTISFFPIMSAPELNASAKKAHSFPGVTPVLLHPDLMMPVLRKADEYTQWAALNKGNEKNLKTLLRDEPYFKSGTGIFSLKSQVRNNAIVSDQKTKTTDKEDSLFQAMLFLRIAQMVDSEKEMINERFSSLQQAEKSLLAILKGVSENDNHLLPPDDGPGDEDAPGKYLTAQRVQAWLNWGMNSDCFDLPEKHPVLVTTSEAAFDYLVSFHKKSVNALDIDNIKVHENNCAEKNIWQNDFYRSVYSAMEKGAGQIGPIIGSGDGCAVNARIRIYLLSRGDAVHNILHRTYETIPVCLVQLNKKNTCF